MQLIDLADGEIILGSSDLNLI